MVLEIWNPWGAPLLWPRKLTGLLAEPISVLYKWTCRGHTSTWRVYQSFVQSEWTILLNLYYRSLLAWISCNTKMHLKQFWILDIFKYFLLVFWLFFQMGLGKRKFHKINIGPSIELIYATVIRSLPQGNENYTQPHGLSARFGSGLFLPGLFSLL